MASVAIRIGASHLGPPGGPRVSVLQLPSGRLRDRDLVVGDLGHSGAAAGQTLSLRAIGNFALGKEADFVVLDSAPASITARRVAGAEDVAEKLFALIMLGDDRAVSATYLLGDEAFGPDNLQQ